MKMNIWTKFKKINSGLIWLTSIDEFFRGTKFSIFSHELILNGFKNVFDMYNSYESGHLKNRIFGLNIQPEIIKIELFNFIEKELKEIQTLQKKRKAFRLIGGSAILIFLISSAIFLTSEPNDRMSFSKKKEVNQIQISKQFFIKSKSYAFARTESDLKEVLRASNSNDIQKINSMIYTGRIKTFTEGKQVILLNQGVSIIQIKDPDTDLEYFGVTESIR